MGQTKFLQGTQGKYIVNDEGIVTETKTQKVVPHTGSRDRGATVLLTVGEYTSYRAVHRIIAEHFIPKLKYQRYVVFKDSNKFNHELSNLQWVNNVGSTSTLIDGVVYPSKAAAKRAGILKVILEDLQKVTTKGDV